MTISICNALEVSPQAWRNGGGQTRELLAWPDAVDWQIRISLADIDTDGIFSAFPNTLRWFSVVEGRGINLNFEGENLTQTLMSNSLKFDGSQMPYCTLIDGSTRDLNLMVKSNDSSDGDIQMIRDASPWHSNCRVRAVLTTTSGIWSDTQQTQRLKPYDFLWSVQKNILPWTFLAENPLSSQNGSAWWISANHSETAL